MSCCTLEGTAKFFSKSAQSCAKKFKKKGLDKPQKIIAQRLSDLGIHGASILEIGYGIGGLHLTLLRRGAGTAVGVEVSEGMLEQARLFANSFGLGDRVHYHTGDFITMDGKISSADIVILDKVLCCYENPELLIAKSAERSSRLYAVSYPRDAVIPKTWFTFVHWLGKLLRWSFYPCYHDTGFLEETIAECGFGEVVSETTPIWQVKIFRRK